MAEVAQPLNAGAARGDGDAMDEDTQAMKNEDYAPGGAADDVGTADEGTMAAPASMDLISQLESDLALLLQIMSSSLHYVANRSAHVQLNADVPLFQPVSGASLHASRRLIDPTTMYDNIEELTDDLVGKAKDMERLLDALPRQQDQADVQRELLTINDDMRTANKEYAAALQDAAALKEELDALLRHTCDEHQAGRAQLAAAVATGGGSA